MHLARLFPPVVWMMLIGAVIVSSIVFTLRSMSFLDMNLYRYIIQPLVILVFAGSIWWFSRGKRSRLRRQHEKALFLLSVMSLWVIGYFLSGLVTTYVQNPLMGTLRLALLNTLVYGATTLLLEYTRHRLILLTGRRHLLLVGGIIAVALAMIQVTTFTFYLPDAFSFVQMLGSVLLPLVTYHVVQTYLAYTSGFLSMVVYAIAWLVLYTLLPVMPKYDWYMVGMSAIVLGVFVIILLDRTRQDVERPLRTGKRQQGKLVNGLFIGCMIMLVLFMTGVFSYKPTAIMSNSMHPVYNRGDMVIVRQKDSSTDIKIGDIIQYTAKSRTITHRVVVVVVDKDVVQYITRGDNSNSNDPWLISESQISGIVKARIPFIGYPTVIVNEMLQGK